MRHPKVGRYRAPREWLPSRVAERLPSARRSPMAWASPPDPTWVTGLYDNADFDEVVTFLTSGMVGLPILDVVIVTFALAYVSTVSALRERVEVSYFRSPGIPRAPPLA